jgi:hypothetical protein
MNVLRAVFLAYRDKMLPLHKPQRTTFPYMYLEFRVLKSIYDLVNIDRPAEDVKGQVHESVSYVCLRIRRRARNPPPPLHWNRRGTKTIMIHCATPHISGFEWFSHGLYHTHPLWRESRRLHSVHVPRGFLPSRSPQSEDGDQPTISISDLQPDFAKDLVRHILVLPCVSRHALELYSVEG